jgi:hypothetical protein
LSQKTADLRLLSVGSLKKEIGNDPQVWTTLDVGAKALCC